MMGTCRTTVLMSIAVACLAARGQETVSFDQETVSASLTLAGGAKVDNTMGREGTGGALRLAPGSKAVWRLRDSDGSGKVDLWVFEDMTKPKDPKQRRVGPRWGLLQSDGRVLVVGAIYAPYLAGDQTYTASDSDQKTWYNVQYLGSAKRTRGWHRWTFDMDANKGLTIAFDGRDVNAQRQRFDWNKTKLHGFVGVVLFGDSGTGAGQTIWADDITVALGGQMTAKPTVPPPPPPS